MKTSFIKKLQRAMCFSLVVLSLFAFNARTAEFVVISDTITWYLDEALTNKPYYWFNRLPSSPNNWKTPNDYYNGQFYTYYEIVSHATDAPVGLQFGIWQCQPNIGNCDHHGEIMEPVRRVEGTVGSSATSNSSPSTWWKKDEGVDFNRVADFDMLGVNIWAVDPNRLIANKWWGGDSLNVTWNARATWFPVSVRVVIVAVSSGSTFSGWGNYLGTKPPVPNYAVDYEAETINKVIPSTDEYSVNADMSGALIGTGVKIPVTPGQNLYFRTRAQGLNPASDIQTLVVPSRPPTPVFTIDYNTETTLETVSSDFEYAALENMSGAVTGDGSKVSLTPGTNRYFRKKSSAGGFRSGIQTLPVPARPAAPQFGIDFAGETTSAVVNSSYEYSDHAGMSPAITGSGQKITLTPGAIKYIRRLATASEFRSAVQALSVPARPETPTFSIDYPADSTTTAVSSEFEYAGNPSMTGSVSGNGSKISITPGTNLYFRKKATGSAFKSAIQALAVPVRPDAPSFGIDYGAEKISELVSADYEYASQAGMSSSVTGDGTRPPLTPGVNIYIRKKATGSGFSSAVQELNVPVRPPAPDYSFGFSAEKTVEPVDAADEYCISGDWPGAVTGESMAIPVLPGHTMDFRKKATPSSFAGTVFQLDIPGRPEITANVQDTAYQGFFLATVEFDGSATGFEQTDLILVNCQITPISTLVYKVEPVAAGSVSLQVKANALTMGNFISDPFEVYYKPEVSGFRDREDPSRFILYPNPAKDYLGIAWTGERYNIESVAIYTLSGNRVHDIQGIPDGNMLDISLLPPGIYLIQLIDSDDGIYFSKFVKE